MKAVNLYKFAAKDEIRPAMCGIFQDAEYSVAVVSDSHVLVVSSSLYHEENAGKIEYKDGTVQELRFPKWSDIVMPCVKSVKEKAGDYVEIDPAVVAGACKNAENFLANAPQVWPEGFGRKTGKKITKNDRWAWCVLPFVTSDGEGKAVAVKYEYLKNLQALGNLRWYAKDERRALYFESEDGSFYGNLMPVMVQYEDKDAAICAGLYNVSEVADAKPEERLYANGTLISANCISAEAVRLFGTPEKRERVPQAKCIESGSRKAYDSAVVRRRPSEEMKPVAGTSTFFVHTHENDHGDMKRYIYKLDAGYYISMGEVPASVDDAKMNEAVDGLDNLTYAEIIVAKSWDISARWNKFAELTGAELPADYLAEMEVKVQERELRGLEESKARYEAWLADCEKNGWTESAKVRREEIARLEAEIAKRIAKIQELKNAGAGTPAPSVDETPAQEMRAAEMQPCQAAVENEGAGEQAVSETELLQAIASAPEHYNTGALLEARAKMEKLGIMEEGRARIVAELWRRGEVPPEEMAGAVFPDSGEHRQMSSRNLGTGTPPKKRKRQGPSFLEIALRGKTIYTWRSAKSGLTSRKEWRQRLLHGRASPFRNPPTIQLSITFESLIPKQYENSFRTSYPHGKQDGRRPDFAEASGSRRHRGMGRYLAEQALRLAGSPGRCRGARDGPDYHGKFKGPFEPREG